MFLYSKDSSNVIDPLSPPSLLRHVEGSGDEIFLLVLNFHHLTLDGVICDVLVNKNVLVLAEPVHPVKALPLAGRVPGSIQQEKMVGSGEIQSDSSGLNYIKVRQSDVEMLMRIFTRRLSSITLGEFCPLAWKTLIASALSWRLIVLNIKD